MVCGGLAGGGKANKRGPALVDDSVIRVTRPHTLNDGSWFISFSAYHVSRWLSGRAFAGGCKAKRRAYKCKVRGADVHSLVGGGKAN